MIFSETWEKVLSGEKTETRRLIGPHDVDCTTYLPSTVMTDMCRIKYQVGKFYAVQTGRGKTGIAHIQLLDIYPEDVRFITDGHVKAEGFVSRAAFFETWTKLNDPKMRFYSPDGSPDEYRYYANRRERWISVDWAGIAGAMLLRPDNLYQAFVYRFELVKTAEAVQS